MNRDIPWPRILAEGAAIVASILLAFAIDAWWSERQERSEERDTLVQLKTEVSRNLSLLAEKRDEHIAVEHAMLRLLQRTKPAASPDYTDEIVVDMEKLLLRFTFDAEMGVVNGLVASGKLSQIRSEELRSAIAGWPAKLQDAVEDETAIWDFTGDQLVPYLYPRASLRSILSTARPGNVYGASAFSTLEPGLLSDRQFENMVMRKLRLTHDILDVFVEIDQYLKHMLGLVEQELI